MALDPLREYVDDDAAEPCEYGCGCPDFNDPHVPGKGPHGRCRSCMARVALKLADASPPQPPEEPTPEGRIIDEWERIEGESMREGHRATLERLIAAAFASRLRETEPQRIRDSKMYRDVLHSLDEAEARLCAVEQERGDLAQELLTVTLRSEKWAGRCGDALRERDEARAAAQKAEQERDEWKAAAVANDLAVDDQVERAQKAEADLTAAIRIAGEAIGTDPSLRSVACVQVLVDRVETLRRELAGERGQVRADLDNRR